MSYLFLIPLCLILSVCMVTVQALRFSHYKLISFLIKAAASLLFVLFAFLSSRFCQNFRFALWVLIGQGLGAFGDIFLEADGFATGRLQENHLLFYVGGFGFFFGHIAYLLVLIPAVRSLWSFCLIASVIAGGLTALCMYRFYQKADLFFKVLSSLYLITVYSLAGFGTGFYLTVHSLPALLIMLGGLFFSASDTILVARMNGNKTGPVGGLILILLYYSAQLLIGGSLQLL